MSVAFTLPKDYAIVVAVGLSTSFLAFHHIGVSHKWRVASGIKVPQVYADTQQMKESKAALNFTCAQRAHANMLEYLPFFLISLAWAGIRYPLPSAAAGLTWIISRMIYTYGYTSGKPGNRELGYGISTASLIGLLGMAFYSTWELYTGKW